MPSIPARDIPESVDENRDDLLFSLRTLASGQSSLHGTSGIQGSGTFGIVTPGLSGTELPRSGVPQAHRNVVKVGCASQLSFPRAPHASIHACSR